MEFTEKSNNKFGFLRAISISSRKGIQKTNVSTAQVVENFGILGDAHAGKWHRQISILAMESIDKMKEAGLDNLKPGDFAENLTTEFLSLPDINIGSKIKIGDSVLLEVTQIGKECHNKCAIFKAVGDCVMPREGIFAKVIFGGTIKVNDIIEIIGIKQNVELQ